MAAINYNDKIKQMVNQVNRNAAPAVQTVQKAEPVQTVTPYTGLSGVSENTQNILGKYGGGYAPSETVKQAQNYLNQVVSGKPGAYQSSHKQQLDNLYAQVMDRPKFSYNVAEDPLYAQYRDQYMNLGNQAMMDTTAQAAALTGGYGNSYAATAGNQAYQAYLQQLNNVVPDLYRMAIQRYQQESDDLNQRYAITADLENQAYGRYQDELSRWEADRNFAQNDYWNQYNADYGQQQDMLNYWSQLAAQENAQWNSNRELAYNQAMAILQAGKTPSAALLEAAGISAADAKTLAKAYKPKSSGGGSGGSGRNSSGGGYTPQPTQDNDEVYKPSQEVNDMLNTYQYEINSEGRLRSDVSSEIRAKVNKGLISKADGTYLLNRL